MTNPFFLSPVSVTDVSSIILLLNVNKSVGPNSIPIYLIKLLNKYISIPLSSLINESFSSGIFPNKLKIAKVTPIFKKGPRADKNNYRPISVLSIFGKIFEKLMYTRLYKYFELHNVLYELQFGFRSNTSTSHALSMTENLKKVPG